MKNPYAFPAHYKHGENDHIANCGMTLRDYFAGEALTGILSNAQTMQELTRAYKNAGCEGTETFELKLSELCYCYADGMLKIRENE